MPSCTRLGPYDILAAIGAGGIGEVYKAKDTKLDHEVAIKVLPSALAQDSDPLARFEREANILAALNHPRTAHIYGLEESAGVRALVMELAGQMLQGPLPLGTALKYAKQIAEALEAAHEKRNHSQDLKPATIIVPPAGVVKVLASAWPPWHRALGLCPMIRASRRRSRFRRRKPERSRLFQELASVYVVAGADKPFAEGGVIP